MNTRSLLPSFLFFLRSRPPQALSFFLKTPTSDEYSIRLFQHTLQGISPTRQAARRTMHKFNSPRQRILHPETFWTIDIRM